MKGIILSGGRGSRLFPLTYGVSKQLMPVYKQPMVFYPLKTLIDMGIKDILIIVASELQLTLFKQYLGDGSKYGISLSYVIQENPNGLAEAFIIGEDFIGQDDIALILGDNVLITDSPINATPNTIFTYKVKDPSAYGVATVRDGKLVEIVEKPKEFISEDAVIGLYVFNGPQAVKESKKMKPSSRGELEIVDLIKILNENSSKVTPKELNGFWFDCGTHDDLLECAEFMRSLDKRTNRDILLVEI